MANRKFSQFTAGGTNQSPTDTLVGLDVSLSAAAQNTYWTLNDLFSNPTRNITDKAMRWNAPGGAPSLSAGGEASLYFDGTSLLVSYNGGAYSALGSAGGITGGVNGNIIKATAATTATDAGFAATSVFLKPTSAYRIYYVSPSGSDANDGLSWGSAKATIAAAAALIPTSGGLVLLSGGTHTVTSPITLTNQSGFTIQGCGTGATVISPSNAMSGLPIFKLVNCRDSVIRDMWIQGNVSFPPSAAIQSLVQAPITVTAANLLFDNLKIGSDGLNSLVDGIYFNYDTFDQNNEQHELHNVLIRNCSAAGWHIEGLNSCWHKMFGGRINGCVNAVKITGTGGAFEMYGTALDTISGTEFLINGPTQSASVIRIVGVSAEANNGSVVVTDSSNIKLHLSHYQRSGGLNNVPMVDWQATSGGTDAAFWMTDCRINGGQVNQVLSFTGSGNVFLTNNFTEPGTYPTFGGSETVYELGNTWNLGVYRTVSKAGNPDTSDIASGHWTVYKNTSSGDLKLWANDGGVMKSVALT